MTPEEISLMNKNNMDVELLLKTYQNAMNESLSAIAKYSAYVQHRILLTTIPNLLSEIIIPLKKLICKLKFTGMLTALKPANT